MFRSKFRIFSTAVAALFLFSAFGFCALFIYAFPEHQINIALFKVVYNLTPAKRSFLESYSPQKRGVANVSIPQEVDQFLCQKIETTTDKEKFAAIVNLYALQSGGREGQSIFYLSDSAKEKVAAEIIEQMEKNPNLSQQLILLEEMRLGKDLGKGFVGKSA